MSQQQSPVNDDSLHGDEGEAPSVTPEISKINVQIPRCSTNLARWVCHYIANQITSYYNMT